MEEPQDEQPRGRVDAVSYLYVILGVPALVGFLVILFLLVNLFPSIPA